MEKNFLSEKRRKRKKWRERKRGKNGGKKERGTEKTWRKNDSRTG